MQKLVSIIVLNWNGQQFLEPCLKALQAQTYPNFEVVLVDNGSQDGSVDFVRQNFGKWERLKLIELSENSGFSGGNIEGLAHSNPEATYIATLNNDTEAEADWLVTLVERLEAKPNEEKWAAACGPMVFTTDRQRVASAGIEIRQDGMALDRDVGRLIMAEQLEVEIFGPCAGAALYRREALNEVGFFDPAFFAYLEDADLAWRLRLAGWQTLYVSGAKVAHVYSGTGKQGSPFKNFQLGRNRVWIILKNMPTKLLLRYLPKILLYDLAACFYTLLFQRDIQPLRGRLVALSPKHLKRILGQRREIKKLCKVNINQINQWLVKPPSLWQNLKLRRTVDRLAQPHTEMAQP